VYDPSTDRWSITSNIPPVGRGTVAVSLKDGPVLISGGGTACGDVYSSAALFDPSSNTWSSTASMEAPAQFHVATLLEDGRVIVSGGTPTAAAPEFIASVYDPSTGVWARAPEPRPLTGTSCDGYVRTYSSALRRNSLIARATPDDCPSVTVLPARTLLIAGGLSSAANTEHNWVNVSDLSTGDDVPSWPMQVARAGHTATRLKNGIVLIAGGRNGAARLASSELYIPLLSYHAWTSAMPRVHGSYVAAATNSHDNLLISYTGGSRHVSHLIEWNPPAWADFTRGTEPSAGVLRFGPRPAGEPRQYLRYGRALGDDLPDLNSIQVDEHDNIWGLASRTQEIIKISSEGQVLLRFGKPAATDISDPSDASDAQLRRQDVENPSDLAVDRRGNVFVTDAGERPRIIKFDRRGRFLAATGRKGSTPGSLDLPHSLATDASGNVYVADSGNARIQVFDNSLHLRAVYHNVGTPWALCVTKGPREFLYSASNPDKGKSHRTAQIYKLELDGTILGKAVGDEPGKQIVTLHHIDCPEANTMVGVSYVNLQRITFAR
jgi:sugar lactone lactonase YvrE